LTIMSPGLSSGLARKRVVGPWTTRWDRLMAPSWTGEKSFISAEVLILDVINIYADQASYADKNSET
jgi:hypothetical protein